MEENQIQESVSTKLVRKFLQNAKSTVCENITRIQRNGRSGILQDLSIRLKIMNTSNKS